MNKLNLKNEVLTASNMQNIKGGAGTPVPVTRTPTTTTPPRPQGLVSGSDPRPKLPAGGVIKGGALGPKQVK